MSAPKDPATRAPEPATADRFVLVFSAPTTSEGLLARGMLEAEGIPVLAKGEGDGPYRIGPMFLWVPEALVIQARLLIEDAQRQPLDDPDLDPWIEP